MRGKQWLNMDQTDQRGFQEYYFIVSSLHRQYSIIGECIGWATNTWKERGQTGKRTNIPSQSRCSCLNQKWGLQ